MIFGNVTPIRSQWKQLDQLSQQIVDVFGDGELPPELPEDGWTWTDETRSDMQRAAALLAQALRVLRLAAERETLRFCEWDERTTQQLIAARGNIEPIR